MKSLSRRGFLRAATLVGTGLMAAACQPKVVEVEKVVTQVVEKIVKETVMVDGKEVVVEKIVKETVVVKEATAAPKEAVNVRCIVWGAAAKMVPMYEMFAQSFHERMPHITVEHLFVPNDQYTPKLKTMEAAGDPPEACCPIGGHLNGYRGPDFNKWVDLRDFVDRDAYDLSVFADSSIFSATNPFNGALDGMPVQLFAGFIVYNKDIFAAEGIEEPTHEWGKEGWNYEAMYEMAIKLTKDSAGRHPGDSGFDPEDVVQYGFYDDDGDSYWGWMFGGQSPQTELEDRTTVKVGEPKFIEGAQYWQDMVYNDRIGPSPVEREAFQGMMSSPFHTGKVAMAKGMTWNVNSYKDITDFKFDFAAEFYGTERDRYNNRLCMDQGTMFKTGKHHDEAWEWFKYVSSEDMAYRYSVDLRECLPARLSAIPKYGERLAAQMPEVDGNVVAESLPFAHYCEYWAPPTDWNEIWQPYEDQVLLNDARPGDVYPEAQVKIQENWDAYYAEHKPV